MIKNHNALPLPAKVDANSAFLGVAFVLIAFLDWFWSRFFEESDLFCFMFFFYNLPINPTTIIVKTNI